MTSKTGKPVDPAKVSAAAERKARLEARLKTNIAKRKAQRSARTTKSDKATAS